MSKAKQLADILNEKAQAEKIPALIWATVKEVDWDKKEMTATGLTDGLDYYEVLLGLGGRYVKPKQDSKVLLGVVEGQAQHTVLLFASEVEEEVLISGDIEIVINEEGIKLNGDAKGGLVISAEVADDLNAIKQDLNNLKTVFQSWVTVPSDGGGALKAAVNIWARQQLSNTQPADLENDKVKHG